MTKSIVPESNHIPQPITVDWDDAFAGNFPETSHKQRWQAVVTQAAEAVRANASPPINRKHLKAPIDIVLSGGVTLHEDGTATVRNGSHTYEITDQCSCADSQNCTRFCKQYLAVLIMREALGQFYNGNGHDNGHQTHAEDQATCKACGQTVHLADMAANGVCVGCHIPEPPADAWMCAQAPSSCTLKWAVGGIELILTLRDATDQKLFNRIGKMLPRIEEKLEAQRQQRQAAREQTQANDGNGNGSNGSGSEGDRQTDDDRWCSIHDVRLKKHEKDGQVWYSHRTGDGTWCRGK